MLQEVLKVPGPRQRLVFQGEVLKSNNRRLLEWDITEGCTLQLHFLGPKELENPIRPLYNDTEPPGFATLVEQAKQGVAKGLVGKLAIDGTGGTYFLRNAQKKEVLVFKPADEEAFAPNNPRGHSGRMGQQSFRPGVLSGEGHLREVAAYILDHNGFAGVPQTARMEVANRLLGSSRANLPYQVSKLQQNEQEPNASKPKTKVKVGSMQAFVKADDVAANLSPSMFPIHEVHKIAVLDIRMVNTDRNDANILVVNRSESREAFLVPIDHAFCLPDTLEIAWTDWAWLDWPQAKQPVDEATKAYVRDLDIHRDIDLLKSRLSIREPCLRLMRITHMLLQRGITRGCTLFQIGSIICRKDIEEPSQLEVMCHQATALAQAIAKQAPTRQLSRKAEAGGPPGGPAPPAAIPAAVVPEAEKPKEKTIRKPSWSPTRTPTAFGFESTPLTSIKEGEDLNAWNSLPLLPTQRSSSSPTSKVRTPSPARRTASTPRPPRPKQAPKPPRSAPTSTIAASPATMAVSPISIPPSLHARVSNKESPIAESFAAASPISSSYSNNSSIVASSVQTHAVPSPVSFTSFPTPSFSSFPTIVPPPQNEALPLSSSSKPAASPLEPGRQKTPRANSLGRRLSPAVDAKRLSTKTSTNKGEDNHHDTLQPLHGNLKASSCLSKLKLSGDDSIGNQVRILTPDEDRTRLSTSSARSEMSSVASASASASSPSDISNLSLSDSTSKDLSAISQETLFLRPNLEPKRVERDAEESSNSNSITQEKCISSKLVRESSKEKDASMDHDPLLSGPLPLFSKRSGDKNGWGERLSRDNSGTKAESLDSLPRDSSRERLRKLDSKASQHQEENSSKCNASTGTIKSVEVSQGVVPLSSVALKDLNKPLELKRAMSYSFNVTVHPTGFAAPGSRSPLKTRKKSLTNNDDWSILNAISSSANDTAAPTSPTNVSDELFFSCLAKLIDVVLDFTTKPK